MRTIRIVEEVCFRMGGAPVFIVLPQLIIFFCMPNVWICVHLFWKKIFTAFK